MKAEDEKLTVTEMAIERRICKVSLRVHVTSAEAYRCTKFVDVVWELHRWKFVDLQNRHMFLTQSESYTWKVKNQMEWLNDSNQWESHCTASRLKWKTMDMRN